MKKNESHPIEQENPTDLGRWMAQAVRCHQANRLPEAESLYRKVIDLDPGNEGALNNLGILIRSRGRLAEAVDWFEQACRQRPDSALLWYGRARALLKSRNLSRALASLDRAAELQPGDANIPSLKSHILHLLKDYPGAKASARKALALDPRHAEARLNLGNALMDLGRFDDALACYDSLCKQFPDHIAAIRNRGACYLRLNRPNDALACYNQVLDLDPHRADVLEAARHLVDQVGGKEDAFRHNEKLLAQNPNLRDIWRALYLLPILYDREEDIPPWRETFDRCLQRLEQTLTKGTSFESRTLLSAATCGSLFFLAYQNQDDRKLLERYGALVHRVATACFPRFAEQRTPAHAGKIRVGYVSCNLYGHTIGKLFGGWIKMADRNQFTVYCYYLGSVRDQGSRIIERWSDHYHHLTPSDLSGVADAIDRDDLDILVYPDIGMDPYTHLLAALRLAPVQCVSWGHPVTTGLPTLDYFLTSELMEPPGAERYYTEKLVRLPNLSVYYQRPRVGPPQIQRRDFGLGQGRIVYLCCQFTSKYLPRHDDIYPRIAREIPQAQFVFINHKHPWIARRFKQRLATAFKAHGLEMSDHCVFLNRLEPHIYFQLNLLADIYLDTIGWSGGNTTLETIACGLPVVTETGRFMRGRHSLAMLKRMGLTETIADDVDHYVDIAVRLAADPEFYRIVKKKTEDRSDRLYKDESAVRALEKFYLKALQKENAVPRKEDGVPM